MDIATINKDFFKKANIHYYIDKIYNDNISMTEQPTLLHTKKYIKKFLLSNDFIGFLLIENSLIIGYIFGEEFTQDKKTYYVNYINIFFNNEKVYQKIFNYLFNFCTNRKISIINILCDNDKYYNLYSKYNFFYSKYTIKNTKFDVMTKLL